MVAYGTYHDGQFELEGKPTIPEGARVRIEVLPGQAKAPTGDEWERFFAEVDAAAALVPEDEWAKLPTDGAINHDHYLYGAPKRELQ